MGAPANTVDLDRDRAAGAGGFSAVSDLAPAAVARKLRLALGLLAAVAATATPAAAEAGNPAAGTTYHVDAAGGHDGASGSSPAAAWKTLARASAAGLRPGDRLLFRRSRRWRGTLHVQESGRPSARLTIGAYGTGAAPRVGAGASRCVAVDGSHVTVAGLRVGGCRWSGVAIKGDHVVVTGNVIEGSAAGVFVERRAAGARIIRNRIRRNTRMSVLTRGGHDDAGAFGVLLQGERAEVAWNLLYGHRAFSYDYGRDGAAVEIYGGIRNLIHHNLAVDNDAFSELGHSRTAGNTYAYNVVRASRPGAHFLVTRGGASDLGPVTRTTLYNNTAVLTGPRSQGVICHGGCGPRILRMRNNIVQARAKAVFADRPFDEDYNLFHGSIQMPGLGPHTVVTDPVFVDPASGDLRLQPGSPAIDRGTPMGHGTAARGAPSPVDGNGDGQAQVDLGAHERR